MWDKREELCASSPPGRGAELRFSLEACMHFRPDKQFTAAEGLGNLRNRFIY